MKHLFTFDFTHAHVVDEIQCSSYDFAPLFWIIALLVFVDRLGLCPAQRVCGPTRRETARMLRAAQPTPATTGPRPRPARATAATTGGPTCPLQPAASGPITAPPRATAFAGCIVCRWPKHRILLLLLNYVLLQDLVFC